MTSPPPPTLDDVRRRGRRPIAAHVPLPTPLVYSPGLSERLDAHVSLKLETANPISVFKLRGGINLISQLPAAERETGVVVASTGNHGQSIAYAAQLFGVRAHVFAPEGANADKVASMRRLGAAVTLRGARYDDARRAAAEFAAEHGLRYVHSSDEPLLVAGVGTAALEVLEDQGPETEVVIVPAGGGSGACGWVTVRDGIEHPAQIWAVQSAQAPALHDSWRAGTPLERPNTTIAEGLATAGAFAYPLGILASLDDFPAGGGHGDRGGGADAARPGARAGRAGGRGEHGGGAARGGRGRRRPSAGQAGRAGRLGRERDARATASDALTPEPRRRRLLPGAYSPAIAFIAAASWKSSSVTPPASWVERSTTTRL